MQHQKANHIQLKTALRQNSNNGITPIASHVQYYAFVLKHNQIVEEKSHEIKFQMSRAMERTPSID